MKIILIILLGLYTSLADALEIVKIYSPYSPGHSGSPAMFRIIEEANKSQNVYKFVLEFKPGANQIIAVKSVDENNLAIIAPAYVENVQTGKLNESDYVPVYSLGDACWAVVTNKPLKGAKEFTVGGVGFGNAAHLTALALGEKYNFKVRYIVFKSNNDALINMAGNNGIEFVIDRYEGYESMKKQNPKLTMIAASCPKRLPQEPEIKTLKEQGINAPYIFNIIIAHKDMPIFKRNEIENILNNSTKNIGETEIYNLSAMRPPLFDNVSTIEFYERSVKLVKELQLKFKNDIESSK